MFGSYEESISILSRSKETVLSRMGEHGENYQIAALIMEKCIEILKAELDTERKAFEEHYRDEVLEAEEDEPTQ